MKVYELVAEALAGSGVRHVFTVMGDGNLHLLDALAQRGVQLVHARHEQGAVAMADGYARAGGGLGICSVTAGAGLSQTATSLATARAHRSPVLLLAGDAPVTDAGRAERFDQLAFGRLAAGYCHTLWTARGVAGTLRQATAQLGRGPVVLNLPIDVQREHAAGEIPAPRLALAPRPPPGSPPGAQVDGAVAALRAARRPIILAGRGAVAADAGPALGALADHLVAPLATTLLAHGLCAGHPRQIGVVGSLGDGRASRALRGADCVYAAGGALNAWTLEGMALDAPVIRVDLQADPPASAGEVPVLGDARVATELVLAALAADGAARPAGPLPSPAGRPDAFDDGAGTVDPRRALLALDDALPRARRLVLDGGHFAIFACQLMTVHDPSQFVFTSDFGAIGQGLATAIGAAIAAPEPRTTLLVGDGGLLMSIAELESAARYRVPLTLFVMNDGGYGQERHSMRTKGLDAELAALPTPDLAAVAHATGAAGQRVDSPGGLESLAPLLAEATGPVLVDVRINGEIVSSGSAGIAATLGGER